jgi:hypothetical protein
MGARFHKVVTPDVILPFRSQPDARSVVEPESSARLLFGRNFQSFASPDALHTIFADAPARLLEQSGDATVAVATILAGQCDDGLRQPIFIAALRGLITLRPPRLMDQAAGLPFTQSFLPSVVNGDAAPLGT